MSYDALVERNVKMPRAKVFAAITDFGGVAKLLPDAVASCDCVGEGIGALRTVELAGGGGKVVERMEVCHDDAVFAYSILENTALPVENYCAVVTLDDTADGGTHIQWGSNWTANGATDDEVQDILHGLYNALIDGVTQAG